MTDSEPSQRPVGDASSLRSTTPTSTPQSGTTATVFAVVVTYEPDPARLAAVLAAALPQVDWLLVVDNSEHERGRLTVSSAVEALAQPERVLLHVSDSNLGLSAAYNVAIERANECGSQYLLLLDQDSIVGERMVSALLRGMQRGEEQAESLGFQGAPATVGPWYTDDLTGRRSVLLRTGRFIVNYLRGPAVDDVEALSALPLMPTEMLISSGSLIPLSVLEALGKLDAALFIDHIDTDWCLRVRHAGLWMAVVPDASMQHQLGDTVLRLWLGRTRLLPVHGPIRLYYTFRNSLWLYRRPHGHWRWILFDLKRLCAVTLIHTLAKGARWPRLKMALRGIFDGLFRQPKTGNRSE